MDKVLAAIGNAPEQEVMSIFSNRFPRLREARNALAHEDERAFGKVGNSLYSGPNLHEGLQFRSQSGSSIFGLKDKTFQDFDIEFDSKAILSLISDLKILFGVA